MGYLVYGVLALPILAIASYVTGPMICMLGIYLMLPCVSPMALVLWPIYRFRRWDWGDYWSDVCVWATCMAVGLSFVLHIWFPAWLVSRHYHLSPLIFSIYGTVVVWYAIMNAPPWAALVGLKYYVSMLAGWIVTIALIFLTFR